LEKLTVRSRYSGEIRARLAASIRSSARRSLVACGSAASSASRICRYDDQVTAITDTSPGGTTLADFTYTIGKDGEVTSATTTGSAITAPTQTYTYNPLGQLTGTGTASYSYDNAADPTTLGATTQTFTAGGQLATATTSGATTSYGYNADGDRTTATTSGATTSYGYNQADQLTTYTPASGAATSDAYNGDGLLTSETTSGTTTSYTWDAVSSVPLMLTAGTTSYLYGPGGLPVESVTSSGSPTYYMQDQLGSTRLLTSATGAVTGTYTYDPWGNITSHTGTATTPLLYAGQYQDPQTGCYYLRNRWYDPATAQFLTIDPDVSQTQAPYTYTADNPITNADPDGLMTNSLGPDCSGMLFKYGACPSERGAAGTTPEEVKQAALGALAIIGSALMCPLFDVPGAGAAAEDAGAEASAVPAQLLRGQQFEADVLEELGLTKNTVNVPGGSIPDAIDDGQICEIKDVKYQTMTSQFRNFLATGQPVNLVVNPDTVVSAPLQEAIYQSGGEILVREASGVFEGYSQ
jgi:RHS repeat-associated protein